MSTTTSWGMVLKAKEIRELKARVQELSDALHLAYDWMGREPNAWWDREHLRSATSRVEEALRGKS